MTDQTLTDAAHSHHAGCRHHAEPALEIAVEAAAPLTLAEAVAKAASRIAPVWPLKSFVAVNPFLGMVDEPFAAACARMGRVAGAEMLMPRDFYRAAVADGRLTDADLARALAEAPPHPERPGSVAALRAALAEDRAAPAPLARTVAEVLDRTHGLGAATAAVEGIGRWAAAYWDEGQSTWPTPWKHLRPYAAWRAEAMHDRTPDTLGFKGFRQAVAALPQDPMDTIAEVLNRIGIPAHAAEPYLHRALASINGWAAYARYIAWNKGLYGEADDTPAQLLAIRLAWDGALFALREDAAFRGAWTVAAQEVALADPTRLDAGTVTDTILQDAYEHAFRRALFAKLPAPARPAAQARKAVQAAFCIDVRSEVYRRALEATSPEVETIGFAGFFGFSIEYMPLGHSHGGAQCPVLLTPKYVVQETVKGADDQAAAVERRTLSRKVSRAWKGFKASAVSSFAYVETAGLLFVGKLVGDSVGLTRTVAHPATEGLDADAAARLGPTLEVGEVGGRETGMPVADRIAMAEAVLRAMSLTGDFARLVLLAGHGSTTVNNPHAAGLDCGACGGHTGEANARVAAAVMNDPAVRAALRERGLPVPEDTWFLGGLHDTTTDEVTLYDLDTVPATHCRDIEQLRGWLAGAGRRARAERARGLGIAGGADVDAAVMRRSRDWSQVRPEWGLAGNAAFIAAPRSRTLGVDLGGRAFLHSYDWRQDTSFGVLELIMTAPMVVASWINLQYYGSTVDNRAFGSGNKVLHNVVGGLGVLQGNGGDLQVGLPWQSVHDGQKLVHEPLRLNVLVEAPEAEIDRVIAKHDSVRQLVENGWVHLFRIAEDGSLSRRTGSGWSAA